MKTVEIAPVRAFANGNKVEATKLNVVSISDNLFDNVTFRYTLYDANNSWAGESTFSLNGIDEYSEWDTSPEGAYAIVANGIGVEIIEQDTKMVFISL